MSRARATLLLVMLACAPARAALAPNAELALERGLGHLYNLDYTQARADFRKLIEQEPDNPFGYLFESGAIWWQASQEYGLFKDTPTLQGLFEQDVEAGIRKADPMTDSKNKAQKADGHFVEGMALGTRGQWALLRGHYIQAYFDGKRAIKHLKKVVKLQPDYHDADLGLGVYDYQAAHLSGIARLGGLLGIRGNEKRGLELIRSAMDRGRYGSRQAAEFLLTIYILDKSDWTAALPVAEKLRHSFPQSVYYRSIELFLRWQLDQKEDSLRLGREIFDYASQDPKSYNRKLLSLVCGMTGERCLGQEQLEGSLSWLSAAIQAETKPSAYRNLLHLYQGYILDALGHPNEARADYDWVLSRPNFSDAHARAQECRRNACAAKDLLLYLRALSRDDQWPPAETGP